MKILLVIPTQSLAFCAFLLVLSFFLGNLSLRRVRSRNRGAFAFQNKLYSQNIDINL